MDEKTTDRVVSASLDYFCRNTFFALLVFVAGWEFGWLLRFRSQYPAQNRRGDLPPPVPHHRRCRSFSARIQTDVFCVIGYCANQHRRSIRRQGTCQAAWGTLGLRRAYLVL